MPIDECIIREVRDDWFPKDTGTIRLECLECGHTWGRKRLPDEVACPECNGTDVELE